MGTGRQSYGRLVHHLRWLAMTFHLKEGVENSTPSESFRVKYHGGVTPFLNILSQELKYDELENINY
jgi:hypothetical protein